MAVLEHALHSLIEQCACSNDSRSLTFPLGPRRDGLPQYATEFEILDAGLIHLKRLTNLRSLSLSGTQVIDAGVVHLKGLAALEDLRLYYTPITGAGVAELRKALSSCKINGQ